MTERDHHEGPTLNELVTVRMSSELWQRVQDEAARRHLGPTTLVRIFVHRALERLPVDEEGDPVQAVAHELRAVRRAVNRLARMLPDSGIDYPEGDEQARESPEEVSSAP